MKLLFSTFFTMLIIGFAGGSHGQDIQRIENHTGVWVGEVSSCRSGFWDRNRDAGCFRKSGLRPDGHGTYTYSNGDIYTGRMVNNSFNGRGTWYYARGNHTATGLWENGVLVITDNPTFFGNGTTYTGDYSPGKYSLGIPNGKGTITYANGSVYTGEIKDGELSGQGTNTLATGDIYVGEFRRNQRNGSGTLTYVNGDVFTGLFTLDVPRKGRLAYANGDLFTGEVTGKPHSQLGVSTILTIPDGDGTFTFSNGDVLTGVFNSGEIKQGHLEYANGAVYIGNVVGRLRSGQGILTQSSGEILSGNW